MSSRRVNKSHRLDRGSRNDKFSRFLKKRPRLEYSPKRRSFLARIQDNDPQSTAQILARITMSSSQTIHSSHNANSRIVSPYRPRLGANVKKLFCRSLKRQHRQKLLRRKSKSTYKNSANVFGRTLSSSSRRNNSTRSPRRKTRAFSPKPAFNNKNKEQRTARATSRSPRNKILPPAARIPVLELDVFCPDLDLDSDFTLDLDSQTRPIESQQSGGINGKVSKKICLFSSSSRSADCLVPDSEAEMEIWCRSRTTKSAPALILGFMKKREGNRV